MLYQINTIDFDDDSQMFESQLIIPTKTLYQIVAIEVTTFENLEIMIVMLDSPSIQSFTIIYSEDILEFLKPYMLDINLN